MKPARPQVSSGQLQIVDVLRRGGPANPFSLMPLRIEGKALPGKGGNVNPTAALLQHLHLGPRGPILNHVSRQLRLRHGKALWRPLWPAALLVLHRGTYADLREAVSSSTPKRGKRGNHEIPK